MGPHRERGAVLVLVVVGMLALIAMAGLALDTAHVLLNKARLQSALDAAALAAAKELDLSGQTSLASTAAGTNFAANVLPFPELSRAGVTLVTQFSTALSPFTPGNAGPYVRTSVTGFTTPMSLISVLGIGSINVAGTAVAGPSPALTSACDIVPVAICGAPGATGPLFGYTADEVIGLNQSAGTASTIGPGNYGLLNLGGNGDNIVRNNLAGSYAGCASVGPGTVNTQPGVGAGPVADGINTRFDIYKATLTQAAYPPDVIYTPAHQTNLSGSGTAVTQGGTLVTTGSQLTFNYASYNALLTAGTYDIAPAPGVAAFNRRILAVPIAQCSASANGNANLVVEGFACVFLLQQLGNGANANTIYAQVIKACDASGQTGVGASAVGPHKIELYKSAGSIDS